LLFWLDDHLTACSQRKKNVTDHVKDMLGMAPYLNPEQDELFHQLDVGG